MAETENPGNSLLGPIAPEDTAKALTALSAWEAMAEGAYSKNTRRAWQADGAVFQAFCEGAGLVFLAMLSFTYQEPVILTLRAASSGRV